MLSAPINMERPRKHSSSRRVNALSPLQALSPLSADRELPKLSGSPTSLTPSTPTAAPMGSTSGLSPPSLRRSLSGRDWAFADRRARRDPNPPENVTTRLILVKAPADADTNRLEKRSPSSSSLHSFASFSSSSGASTPQTPRGSRRSFAASFSSMSSMGSATPREVGGNTRLDRKPTLSPEEVADLARGLMSPVAAPEPGSPESRRRQRRKSTGTFSGAVGGAVPAGGSGVEPEPAELEPVEYREMDPANLLPFSDRPREVAELLASEKNAQLAATLQQAFPKTPVRSNWKECDVRTWSWPELHSHLTMIDRTECPDYAWVLLARDAVRRYSVALWENLGACLGCDTELMMAGEEDDAPASWGGLGLGEEGEYDPTLARVYIEGLEPKDGSDEPGDADLIDTFNDHGDSEIPAVAGFSSGMMTIGEESAPPVTRSTAAPLSTRDPFPPSPRSSSRPMSRDFAMASSASSASSTGVVSPSSSPTAPSNAGRARSKSFVGLQILASPPQTYGSLAQSPTSFVQERTPGNPLFPSSFNTLSLAPNLGRKATMTVPPASEDQFRGFATGYNNLSGSGSGGRIQRRSSGTGLSDSAITFVSDSSVEAAAMR